jgi:DNA-binding LytR/AlgR family response regulator
MNTLRQAVHEYLSMRRNLGFQLREAGKGLLNFVTFLEQHHAPYITQALALAWAGKAIEFCTRICPLSQFERSTHADPIARSVTFPTQAGATLFVLGCRDPKLIGRRA